MNVGQNIRRIRKEKRLTQKQLANILEVSEPMVSQYEAKNTLKIETIKKIAKALEVDYHDLLDYGIDIDEINRDLENEVDKITKARDIYDIFRKLERLDYHLSLPMDINTHYTTLKLDPFKEVTISDDELILLQKESDDFLKFKLLELVKSKQ